MIVFAVHDRVDMISDLLDNLNMFNKKDVIIIDTNSSNNNVIDFYKNLNKDKYNFKIFYDRVNYNCYDSGAYIHVFQNYDSDIFYFFQDSIEFINPNIFNQIDAFLESYDVVAISSFPLIFDNQSQIDWILSNISVNEINKLNYQMWGIFGPMFSIKKSSMNKIPKEWLISPSNKNEAMSMERKWSIIFNILNFKTIYLEKDHIDFLSDNVKNNFINKKMLGRQ